MTAVSMSSNSRSTPSRSTLRNSNNSNQSTTTAATQTAKAVLASVTSVTCGVTNTNRRSVVGRFSDDNAITVAKWRNIGTICIGITLVVVGLVVLLAGGNGNNTNSGKGELVYYKSSLDTMPIDSIELWPDHHYHYDPNIEEKILDIYYDCIPVENSDCRERVKVVDSNGDGKSIIQKHTIAILRPPGILGDVVEKFVLELIQKSESANDNTHIEFTIHKTSHIDPENYQQYTKVIRPSILPFLLEASDLALRSTESTSNPTGSAKTNDEYHPADITIYDLLGIIRQIMRWHIRISYSVGKDTALYTIPFDRMMAYPADIEKDMRKFLNLYPTYQQPSTSHHNEHPKMNHVQMDKFAEKVIQRVDACNALVMRIMKDDSFSASTIHKMVDDVIQEELVLVQVQLKKEQVQQQSNQHEVSSSHSMLLTRPLRGRPIQHSRATDLVGYFLDRTSNLSEKICFKYPKSYMCLSDTSDQPQVIQIKMSETRTTTATVMR